MSRSHGPCRALFDCRLKPCLHLQLPLRKEWACALHDPCYSCTRNVSYPPWMERRYAAVAPLIRSDALARSDGGLIIMIRRELLMSAGRCRDLCVSAARGWIGLEAQAAEKADHAERLIIA